jgi:hypothetical protein
MKMKRRVKKELLFLLIIGVGYLIPFQNFAQCKASFLGADTTVYFCPGSEIDLTKIYGQANLLQKWTTDYPYNADKTGIYTLIGTRIEGCSDTVMVTLTNHAKPSIGEDKTLTVCAGITTNLLQLINPPDYVLAWSTENPSTVLKGIYRVIGTDKNNCNDTAYVEIKNHPTPELGENQIFCLGTNGEKGDLTLLTDINPEGLTMQWGTPSPTQAPPGTYNIVGTNATGCSGTVTIQLKASTKPDLGEDQTFPICWNGYANLNDRFDITNLNFKWDATDPELAEPGIYEVIATQVNTGCKDTALVMVAAFPRPGFNDTTIFACEGKLFDLNTVFNLENYPNHVWETSDPSGVLGGTYSLLITDDEGCEETIFATIIVTATGPKEILPLTTYNMQNAPFTTNHFRTILADRFGNIYAGAQEGGMYFFDGVAWKKSDFHPQNTYKDLIEYPEGNYDSEEYKFSKIFAASIGHENLYAKEGGVDEIRSLWNGGEKRILHEQLFYWDSYYYLTGGFLRDSGGGLRTRYSNSLTIGSDKKLYVAQGQMLRIDTAIEIIPFYPYFKINLTQKIVEGGAFELNLTSAGAEARFRETNLPRQLNDVRVDASGWRNEDEVWFAVDRSCFEGVCADPYIVRYNTKGTYKVDLITEAISPIPFSTKNFLTIRSIYTDSEGRTYVGLSDGIGIAVMDKFNQWSMINPANSKLPIGASINSNAITEIGGKIWIGTNKGLLVYEGTGNLTDCNSYTLYTIENGLPSNNITDIAYNTSSSDIWLTSDNGISSFKYKSGISANVFSITFLEKRFSSSQPFDEREWSEIVKIPLKGGNVKIFDKNEVEVGKLQLDDLGGFNWQDGKQGGQYRVVIDYFGKPGVYEYRNVKWNASLGNINMVIDDRMLNDMKEFEEDLTKGFPIIPSVPGDFYSFKGFDTVGFYKSVLAFSDTIRDNHNKRAENLLLYVLCLRTIQKVSEWSALMSNESEKSMFYTIESLLDLSSTKNMFYINQLIGQEDMLELAFNMSSASKVLGELLKTELYLMSSSQDNKRKKIYDKYASFLMGMIEPAFEFLKLGEYSDLQGIIDVLIEEYSRETRSWFYTYICQDIHNATVSELAKACNSYKSTKQYNPSFNRLLIFPEQVPQSLHANVFEDYLMWSRYINEARSKSKAEFEKLAFENIQVLLGGENSRNMLEAKMEDLVKSVNEVQNGYLIISARYAVNTGVDYIDSSFKAIDLSGFPPMPNNSLYPVVGNSTVSSSAPGELNQNSAEFHNVQQFAFLPLNISELQQQELLYKQRLIAIKDLHKMPYDSITYKIKSRELRFQDSLYSATMSRTLHSLWPSVRGAIAANPSFEGRLTKVIDSFVTKQYKLRQGYFLKDVAYRLSSNKSSKYASIDSLIDRIVLLNDSAIAGIEGLINEVNTRNIEAPAWLVLERTEMRFNHQHGSTGRASYTFKNYGSVPQYNVSFKISPITGGFTLAGSDRVFAEVIYPGEAKRVDVSFASPLVDTVGSFSIDVKASNGEVPQVRGMLYTLQSVDNSATITIKSGLWSDPTTWSTGRVPINVTAVTIKHNVTVDIDATCKTLKAESPAQVQVAAGKKLTVLE